MKLRIEDNTLRIRLDKSEAMNLSKLQQLAARTEFQGSMLHYTLAPDANEQFSANFNGSEIRVTVPASLLSNWEHRLDESIRGTAGELNILVEQDLFSHDAHEEKRDQNPKNNP